MASTALASFSDLGPAAAWGASTATAPLRRGVPLVLWNSELSCHGYPSASFVHDCRSQPALFMRFVTRAPAVAPARRVVLPAMTGWLRAHAGFLCCDHPVDHTVHLPFSDGQGRRLW